MVKYDHEFERAAKDPYTGICQAVDLFLPENGEPVLSVLPSPELKDLTPDETGFQRAAELSAPVMASLGFDTGPEIFDLTVFESSEESEPLRTDGLEVVDSDLPYVGIKREGQTISYASVNDLQEEKDKIEIYVETAEEHRSRGYGTVCVCTLRNVLIKKGYSVKYVTGTDNAPSVRVAEKAGFTKTGRRLAAVFYKLGGE